MSTGKRLQPAVLLKKIERLEALLDAEKTQHKKTFDHMRELLYEVVDVKLKNERAVKALSGEDEE